MITRELFPDAPEGVRTAVDEIGAALDAAKHGDEGGKSDVARRNNKGRLEYRSSESK